MKRTDGRPWGLLAEFERPPELLEAARRARDAGYTRTDAYTPYPVDGLDRALGVRPTRLPAVVLAGGLAGAAGGYFLQYYLSAVEYPLNVGGRPLHSWPAFVVITFELAVLSAAVTAVVAMLTMNGLPQPYHPVFNVGRFALASRDRFFLSVEASDPKFDPVETKHFLESLQPHGVYEIPP